MGAQSKPIKVPTAPSEGILIDQMISSQVGIIAHLKGRLIHKQYKAAAIFNDYFSHLRYMHLHDSLSSDKTVQATMATLQTMHLFIIVNAITNTSGTTK